MSREARSIGRYRLVRRLGAGGAADVWEATTPDRPGTSVAFKLLKGAAGPDSSGLRRFLAEARIGASLNHPHIVRAFEAGVENGRAFLVMELLEGATLTELSGAEPPMPVGLVIALGRQLMSALDHAHNAASPEGQPLSLVHRDIKPSNLFLTSSGALKVIDFGIATAPWLDRTVTRTGLLRGSLPYVSPEQARGEAVDARTDLFSAGLVLHELLTGRRVFDQESESAILTALLFGPIPSLRARRPDVPLALNDLIAKMVARAPADRPAGAAIVGQSLAELATALADEWSHEDIARWLITRARQAPVESFPTPTADTREPVPEPAAPAPAPRRWHVRAAVAIGVAALLSALGVFMWQRDRPVLPRSAVRAKSAFPPPPNDRQPAFPVRAAFYYPPVAKRPFHLGSHFNPTVLKTAGSYEDALRRHREGLQYGKIQVAISSWPGPNTHRDRVLRKHLDGSADTALRWTVYFESEGYDNPAPDRIESDLRYLGQSYARHPAYFRVDGRFVVFVYKDLIDRCDAVDRWLRANTVGAYLVLFAFAGYEQCENAPDAWHDYAATSFHALKDASVSVAPGVWPKTRASPFLERNLERFRADVRKMTGSRARFHLIITFNEWFAGTAVDAADEWASDSGFGDYLDVLHRDGK